MNGKIFLAIVGLVLASFILILVFNNSLMYGDSLFSKASGKIVLDENFEKYENINSKVIKEWPIDLSKWQKRGVITARVNINDYEKIHRLDLVLNDGNGKRIILKGIENLTISREKNLIKSNDAFPDYDFKLCSNQRLKTWEDFMIINGKNLVFWEWDQSLDINMENIAHASVMNDEEEIGFSDMVIHDGLCKEINSLNGNWYSPNGLPQYGLWWVENSRLIMRNVKQGQYPSNGDHVRILSKIKTPKNFAMRINLNIDKFSGDFRKDPILKYFFDTNRDNTYIRIAWDFDDVYDPGHDQSLLYLSGQYSYMGLQRVYPIERYSKQGQEPSNNEAKVKVELEEGKTYEINMLVEGQYAKAVIYEDRKFYLKKLGEVEYTFNKSRLENEFPFSIESTGNIEISINNIRIEEI